jgi:hypothetical protein
VYRTEEEAAYEIKRRADAASLSSMPESEVRKAWARKQADST